MKGYDHMKKTVLSALLAAAVICISMLVSCGGNDSAPMGFKEISDESLTYHFYVPDEWTTDISTGVTSAYFSGVDPSSVSMTAFELDRSITSVDDYWSQYENDFKSIFADFEYVDKSECTLDGSPAKQYIYTATLTGEQYKFMQVVTIKNNQVYIFTYTALAEMYDSHIEDVLAILDYFDFK